MGGTVGFTTTFSSTGFRTSFLTTRYTMLRGVFWLRVKEHSILRRDKTTAASHRRHCSTIRKTARREDLMLLDR